MHQNGKCRADAAEYDDQPSAAGCDAMRRAIANLRPRNRRLACCCELHKVIYKIFLGQRLRSALASLVNVNDEGDPLDAGVQPVRATRVPLLEKVRQRHSLSTRRSASAESGTPRICRERTIAVAGRPASRPPCSADAHRQFVALPLGCAGATHRERERDDSLNETMCGSRSYLGPVSSGLPAAHAPSALE